MPDAPRPPRPLASGDPVADGNDGDVALMARVREKDAAAFEQLVRRHQHAVIGTVAKMLGSPRDAEDIAQQVFLRVWKSAPRYEPTAKFTTWLFTITRNLVFNECRRRHRHQEVSIDEREDEHHIEAVDDATTPPDQATLHAELEAAIDRAIQALPEKQRMAVVLRRYEELPYEDIAAALGLSLPAVKSVLFRARAQLKELLKDYVES
jgi:RNA polymerase sigma-70 factor (ECF subfamily)